MAFIIEKQEGLNVEECGYHTLYLINYTFETQTAEVELQIWPITEARGNKNIRLESNTDGYHWLQFFLSQKDNAIQMEELDYTDQIHNCIKLFQSINVGYFQEDKESAWLMINKPVDMELVTDIAELIERKFANRERFFD